MADLKISPDDYLRQQGALKVGPEEYLKQQSQSNMAQSHAAPAPQPSAWALAGEKLGQFAKGVGRMASDVGAVAHPELVGPQESWESAKRLGSGVLSMVTEPAKEIFKITPQSQHEPLYKRIDHAVIGLMGGDPHEVQGFVDRGEVGHAVAAMTIPVVNAAISWALPERAPAPGIARPLNRRAGLMTFATENTGATGLWDKFKQVIPYIDDTLQGRVPPKKDISLKWAADRMADTGRRLENEFQTAKLPYNTQPVDLQPVIDAVKAKKRTVVESEDDVAYNKAIDGFTKEFEPPAQQTKPSTLLGPDGKPLQVKAVPEAPDIHTLEWVDQKRRALFEIEKDTAAQRLAPRTQPITAAERAANHAIKDFEYDTLGMLTGKIDYWRRLKLTQSNLLDIQDATNEAVDRLNTLQGRYKGMDLWDMLRPSTYMNVLSAGKRGGATLHPPSLNIFRGGPEKVAAAKVGKAFIPKGKIRVSPSAASELILGRGPREADQQ